MKFVPREGVEPSCLATHDFESCAYTNSATEANAFIVFPEAVRKLTKLLCPALIALKVKQFTFNYHSSSAK